MKPRYWLESASQYNPRESWWAVPMTPAEFYARARHELETRIRFSREAHRTIGGEGRGLSSVEEFRARRRLASLPDQFAA